MRLEKYLVSILPALKNEKEEVNTKAATDHILRLTTGYPRRSVMHPAKQLSILPLLNLHLLFPSCLYYRSCGRQA
jgi:hypothetical protein